MEQEQKDQDSSFEEVQKAKTYEIKIELSGEIPAKISRIFIGLYGACSLYLQWKSENTKQIGRINFSKQKQQSLANILVGSEDTVLVIFNQNLENFQDHDFARILFAQFPCENIIIMNAPTYQGFGISQEKYNENQIYFLKTRKALMSNSIEIGQKIPVGLQVDGIAAQIFTFCQINNKIAELYEVVQNDFELTLESFQIFKPFETKFSIFGKEKKTDELNKEMKKYNKLKFSNNLYL